MKAALLCLPLLVITNKSCGTPPVATSGAEKITVKVHKDAQGLTAEQRNIRERLIEDNKSGSVKHLYVISAYSGQVLLYSTVRGKVTSGGKRLTPTTVAVTEGRDRGFNVKFGQNEHTTGEVLQDDGTYGHSMDYLFWWDAKGIYHQHYVSGGQIVHISSQPISVKSIVINMEVSQKTQD